MRLVAAAQADPGPAPAVKIPPMLAPVRSVTSNRILGIDIENYPDWYGGGDYVYDRLFCVSHKWVGTPDTDVYVTWIDWDAPDWEITQTLKPLYGAMLRADSFLGHNFRHDWKGLAALYQDVSGFAPLERKPVVDTMRCIPSGRPRSLENLCDKFQLGDKPHLTNHDWTLAIRRKDPAAIERVKHRNRMDVILTERLYRKEQELGWIT